MLFVTVEIELTVKEKPDRIDHPCCLFSVCRRFCPAIKITLLGYNFGVAFTCMVLNIVELKKKYYKGFRMAT